MRRARPDPKTEPRPDWHAPAAALAVFALIALAVSRNAAALQALDQGALSFARSLRGPLLDHVVIAITELGDTEVVWPLGVGLTVYFYLIAKMPRTAALWAVTLSSSSLINSGFKWLFGRTRPTDVGYEHVAALSFPSGHTTVNLTLYGLLALLVLHQTLAPPALRRALAAAFVIFAVLIGASRVYLGAHWLSDVLASTALAAALLAAAHAYLSRLDEGPLDLRGLTAALMLCLAIFGGIHLVREHARDVERYALRTASPAAAVPIPGGS